MLSDIASFFDALLGLHVSPDALGGLQISTRALLVYLAGFALLRFGEHRFLGKNTAFDIVLGFILGSLLSRAINGAGPLWPTLLAGAVLLGLHWLFAAAASRFDRFQQFIVGQPHRLIKDGRVDEKQLRKSRISKEMLRENLRVSGQITTPEQADAAYYEPSGNISVIPKAPRDRSAPDTEHAQAPRVVEVSVEEGVQTVRIELP